MPALSTTLPAVQNDLIIRAVGDDKYVVKHPGTGAYFRLGLIEHFLLTSLNGTCGAEELRQSFKQRFAEELSAADLEEFIGMLRSRNLLVEAGEDRPGAPPRNLPTKPGQQHDEEEADFEPLGGQQSLLYWRKRLFDPDRLLSVLAPRVWLLWTRPFVAASGAIIVFAAAVAVANWHELAARATQALRWESAAIAWLTVVCVTVLHEFAHGLTCKHFGGEVREIGVLFVLFTPCLYCNVSDAWLFPQKSRRVWVTLSGGYCDLCLWALAVLGWRLTEPSSLPNYLAWIVATVCGGRMLFNFNPLARLDGYYLLSDWLEIPNLRPRAAAYWKNHVRWLLWGAPKPAPERRGGWLLIYGLLIWSFAATFLVLTIAGLLKWTGQQWWSYLLSALLTALVSKRVFKGVFTDEFKTMLKLRRGRTALWAGALLILPGALAMIPWSGSACGEFQVRPGTRGEVRAPVAGFIESIAANEGDTRTAGQPVAHIRVPELESLITRKQAEIEECAANLRRLRAGARPEQLEEQHARVARALAWRDLAQADLERARQALQLDLKRLELEIEQIDTELDFSAGSMTLDARLFEQGALAGETLRAERKRQMLLNSQRAQAVARRDARQAEGVKSAEEEVVRRDKELAEARAALHLLEAGTRQEEIDAEIAKQARLQEELAFLLHQRTLQVVQAPIAGVVATPRMADKVGQYVDKGELICVLEDVTSFQVEIVVPEEEAPAVCPDQVVELKARALPFETFHTRVERVAPAVLTPENGIQPQTGRKRAVTVYCQVQGAGARFKSGMSGYARIACGRKSLASMLLQGALKHVRTEFWW